MNTKKLLIALALIIVLVVAFFSFNAYIYKQKQGTGANVPNGTQTTEPYRGTLTGVQICLPHADTKGPQTMECAIGIKTDSGENYALNFAMMSQTLESEIMNRINRGERFAATGLITPIETLNTDHWQKYDMKGIFSVTDSVKIEAPTATSPAGTVPTGKPSGKLPPGSAVPGDPTLLKANTWVWETALVGGDAVVAPEKPDRFTLTFAADGKFTGTTDCNGFGGTYNVGSDGVINLETLMSTKMYCENSQESTYTGLLSEVSSYRLENGKLVLSIGGGATTVTFRKK